MKTRPQQGGMAVTGPVHGVCEEGSERLLLATAHGASKVFSIGLTAIAGRLLGPAGYGLYATGSALVEVLESGDDPANYLKSLRSE